MVWDRFWWFKSKFKTDFYQNPIFIKIARRRQKPFHVPYDFLDEQMDKKLFPPLRTVVKHSYSDTTHLDEPLHYIYIKKSKFSSRATKNYENNIDLHEISRRVDLEGPRGPTSVKNPFF